MPEQAPSPWRLTGSRRRRSRSGPPSCGRPKRLPPTRLLPLPGTVRMLRCQPQRTDSACRSRGERFGEQIRAGSHPEPQWQRARFPTSRSPMEVLLQPETAELGAPQAVTATRYTVGSVNRRCMPVRSSVIVCDLHPSHPRKVQWGECERFCCCRRQTHPFALWSADCCTRQCYR